LVQSFQKLVHRKRTPQQKLFSAQPLVFHVDGDLTMAGRAIERRRHVAGAGFIESGKKGRVNSMPETHEIGRCRVCSHASEC
jgi:hypothetical protein